MQSPHAISSCHGLCTSLYFLKNWLDLSCICSSTLKVNLQDTFFPAETRFQSKPPPFLLWVYWCYLHDKSLEGLLGLQLEEAVLFWQTSRRLSRSDLSRCPLLSSKAFQTDVWTNLSLSLLPLSHIFVRWYFNNPFLAYISAKRLRKESVDTQSVSCMHASHCRSLPPCSFFVFIQPSLSRASSCQNPLQCSDAQCTSTEWLSVHSFFS